MTNWANLENKEILRAGNFRKIQWRLQDAIENVGILSTVELFNGGYETILFRDTGAQIELGNYGEKNLAIIGHAKLLHKTIMVTS